MLIVLVKLQLKTSMQKTNLKRGFTLIEIMVASSIFVIIIMLSSGSILTIFDANQKSKNLRSSMDNLNFTLESMTRAIRFGSSYHCSSSNPPTSSPRDCDDNQAGSSTFYFLDDAGNQVRYTLNSGTIYRSINGSSDYALTSSDITIDKLTFRVYGSAIYPDLFQPQVIIVISGHVGTKAFTNSTFTLHTSISQRRFDFQ